MNVYIERLRKDFPALKIVPIQDSKKSEFQVECDHKGKMERFCVNFIDINERLFNRHIYNTLRKNINEMLAYIKK